MMPSVCRNCGAVEHVHRGLCRRCRHALNADSRPLPAEGAARPMWPPLLPLRHPPSRRRGA